MLKVLLVEDSPTQALEIQMLLESAGHQVERAANGNDALRTLRKGATDLVVTDLEMPEMTGLQLVEQMLKEFPSIPAILITVHGSEHLAVKALRCGAAAYVPKSMLDGMLRETIEEVMGVMRAERILPAPRDRESVQGQPWRGRSSRTSGRDKARGAEVRITKRKASCA